LAYIIASHSANWGQISNTHSSTWLVFEGLDTFTHIELCGQEVANTANQFRQFIFDVSSIVSQCKSELNLALNFGSASKIVLEIAKTGDGKLTLRLYSVPADP
jgi:beta-mannosidase